MKIGKSAEIQQTEVLRAVQAAGTRQVGAAGGGAIEKANPATSVRLSDTARSFAPNAGAAEQPFRAEKVEEVRRAIAEGRFVVNAEAVADKMIAQSSELLTGFARSQ